MSEHIPSSPMVQRVAEALCMASGMNPNNWQSKQHLARAAIEAMMEPTDEMIDAAWSFPNFDGPIMDHRKSDLREYWQAMLRASLQGDEP